MHDLPFLMKYILRVQVISQTGMAYQCPESYILRKQLLKQHYTAFLLETPGANKMCFCVAAAVARRSNCLNGKQDFLPST